MEVVWEATETFLPHDRIGISFIDKDSQRVTSRYFKTRYPLNEIKLGKEYSAGLAGSSLERILEKGHARIIHDLPTYLAANPHSRSTRLLVEEEVKSSLTIPLKVENRWVGFLFFSSRESWIFQETHAGILLLVAYSISQTLEKIWRITQLEEMQRDYMSIMGFVSHEMKSPLSSLISVGKTYTGGYMGKPDPQAVEAIHRMNRIASYMIQMVNDYLDLSRMESGELAYAPEPEISLKGEIIDFALDTVSDRAKGQGSEIIVHNSLEHIRISADPGLLKIVMVNMLDNAVKYGKPETPITLTVSEENSEIMVSVRNEGIGFTPEEGKRLFKRFSRLKQKGTEKVRGSGLGLYLSWWIIQKHGGRFEAASEPGKWAEFRIYLKKTAA
jgi:signal transduction histidine kinase